MTQVVLEGKTYREVAWRRTKLVEVWRLPRVAQLYWHNDPAHPARLHAHNSFFKGRDHLEPAQQWATCHC